MRKFFSLKETRTIGNQIGINWFKHDPEQFRIGLEVELEHVTINQAVNVTNDDYITTGKITLTHLNEFPDYYDRLVKLKNKQNKPPKPARIRYAIDASVDSIVDPPFTETYQRGYKQNIRDDRKLMLDAKT